MTYFVKLSRHVLITDPFLRWSLMIIIVLMVIALVWLGVALEGGKSLLAIHRTAVGPNFFGTRVDAFSVPLIATGILFVNELLVVALARRVRAMARIISFFNVWFAVLLLISVGAIIAAN